MAELSQYFPPGMKVIYPFDTTPFVRVAIGEVVKTLLEAIVLVFLVMYLFMGNLRATLIPTIAVPVVILGTFGVLGAFGYSINMLTMFAMVLAIGLLVDDAIVVVENVERVMSEEGLPPLGGHPQVDGARSRAPSSASASSCPPCSAPMIFFPGSTGVIYRQFSVTVIASMLLSVVVALVLTPGALRLAAQAGGEGARGGRDRVPPAPARSSSGSTASSTACATSTWRSSARILGRKARFVVVFLAHRRGHGLPLPADADRLPPRRGPGHAHDHGPAARRLHPRADRRPS